MATPLNGIPGSGKSKARGLVRWGTLAQRATPSVLWLAAVIVAIRFGGFGNDISRVIGFAEADQITIANFESGVVRRVHVHLHSHVEPGQILLEMDDRIDRVHLAAMRVEVERLRAEVPAEEARLVTESSRVVGQASSSSAHKQRVQAVYWPSRGT